MRDRMNAMSVEDIMASRPEADASEKKDELLKQRAAHFESDIKPLLDKSFDRHDTNRSKVLDPEEAVVFFSNLTGYVPDIFASSMSRFAPMVADHLPLKPASDDGGFFLKKVEEKLAKTHAALVVDYKNNKEAMDKAAFALLDVNKDGTLQFDEFCKMFSDEAIREQFFDALGLGMKAFFTKIGELMSAPFLDEAMQKSKAWMTSQPEELLSGMMPGAADEAKTKFDAAYKAHFESDLKELLTKSFDRHDTKKNQVLDAEEAEVFFGNMIRVVMNIFGDTKKVFAPMLAPRRLICSLI